MQNGGLVRLRIGEAKGDFASFHFQEFKNYSYRGGGTRILMFQENIFWVKNNNKQVRYCIKEEYIL